MNVMTDPISAASFPATVRAIARVTDAVTILLLQLPEASRMLYVEGQFLSIALPGGDSRCYSMATATTPEGTLELHVRLHPQGKFSTILRDGLRVGDALMVTGPFGDCTWQRLESTTTRVVLLATGTGIAPLKAMLEHALPTALANPISLFWGCRTDADFYLGDLFREWAGRHANFSYFPVLDASSPAWAGERGLVQEIAAKHHPDLSDAFVYACGAPGMIASARAALTAGHGLLPDRFFADVFDASAASLATLHEPGETVMVAVGDGHTAAVPTALPLRPGSSLMTSLREVGLIEGVCGGQASCGTCRIRIDSSWVPRLTAANKTEARLLRALGDPNPLDRLACQIPLAAELDGLQITIPR
ncbi:MAG: CDP-6-deoxy-delta-3,4-glucoseen reductase [Rhizobacter sp.]|nr:CDP-6-deoxy-delta-3,4-glucoseen reductase [Rhizobacter sp.]